ncbi:MAG: type II CAAX endopeptidase family protein [Pseudomonadota bacterium]
MNRPIDPVIGTNNATMRAAGQQFFYELTILAGVFFVATAVLAYAIYPLIGWPSAAPMPMRSIALALTIVVLVTAYNGGLASLGLARPRSIWLTALLVIGFIALKLFVQQPAMGWIREIWDVPPSDTSFFDHIYGNLGAYLGWLVIAWAAGGFAEEIIFRGYLMNRIAGLAGNSALAWVIAIVAQAVIFGLGHYYQGVGGMIGVGFGALLSGTVYVLVKRNLWVLIVTHGVWDTLGITLIYFNGAPSTG